MIKGLKDVAFSPKKEALRLCKGLVCKPVYIPVDKGGYTRRYAVYLGTKRCGQPRSQPMLAWRSAYDCLAEPETRQRVMSK